MTDRQLTENEQLTPDEWRRRYAARIMEVQKWPEHAAIQESREALDSCGHLGDIAPIFRNDPEGAADEDMSSWSDDSDE